MTTFVLRATAPTEPRLILTTALAYANARLHLGHALEAVLADAFARSRKAWGQDVTFLGADDNHGTATELRAAAEGTTPEALSDAVATLNKADYAALDIGFSTYHRTHGPENEGVCTEVFGALHRKGLLVPRTTPQLYDPVAGRFLDDRRVRGTCPSCARPDQPAGGCPCGVPHEATELLDPVSVLSGATPVLRDAEHLHLDVDRVGDGVRAWIDGGGVGPSVAAKLRSWTHGDGEDGFSIRPWCITRKGPYFGFQVPGEEDLFFYVWFDAPLGYLAALAHHIARTHAPDTDWRTAWNDPDTEVVQVIGKDIVAFHGLFWPALLEGADLRLPTRVHAHGFLTCDGAKLSKSAGTAPTLAAELARLPVDTLRLGLAAQAGFDITDGDLKDGTFASLHNGFLVGKVANIALRLRPLLVPLGNRLADALPDPVGYQEVLDEASEAIAAYDAFDTAKVVRAAAALADRANGLIAHAQPWKEPDAERVRDVATQALAILRVVAVVLAPITPRFAESILRIFPDADHGWTSLKRPPLGCTVDIPERLLERLPTKP